MRNGNVLISGAGPAGMMLAYWLGRHGFSPTVVERAPAPRDGGQAVDVRGAAIEVAGRTGILDELRRARTGTRGMSYVNSTGKSLASMNAAFGVIDAADVEIVRGDLVRILHKATTDNVEYIFADSITGICQNADRVEVTFERAPSRVFDLVVGADGLHSNVRALVFGHESRFTHYLGLYLAIFTIPNDLGLDHWQLIHAVPGKSVTITSARENTEARAIFFFASPPLDYDHHDTRQQQDILADAFSAEQWEVSRLLKAMRNAPDFYFDSASQIRMDGNREAARDDLDAVSGAARHPGHAAPPGRFRARAAPPPGAHGRPGIDPLSGYPSPSRMAAVSLPRAVRRSSQSIGPRMSSLSSLRSISSRIAPATAWASSIVRLTVIIVPHLPLCGLRLTGSCAMLRRRRQAAPPAGGPAGQRRRSPAMLATDPGPGGLVRKYQGTVLRPALSRRLSPDRTLKQGPAHRRARLPAAERAERP